MKTARLAALSALLFHLSATPAQAAEAFVLEADEEGLSCVIMRRSDEGVNFLVKINQQAFDNHELAFLFVNTRWSITAEQDVGEIFLLHSKGAISVTPIAGDHGFFFRMPARETLLWIEDNDDPTLALYRRGEMIALFNAVGLADDIRSLARCAVQQFR